MRLKFGFLVFTLFSFLSLQAQVEICGNGIDDDNNGMTDKNDTACVCRPRIETSQNPVNIQNPEVDFIGGDPSWNLQWTFHDGSTSNSPTPTFRFPQLEGEYPVKLTAIKGTCVDSADVLILVNGGVVFFIPNAFTPDGDEFNNTFKPVFTSGVDPFDFKLLIFNRWGETVFESNDYNQGWDGTYHNALSREGVYLWTIEYKDLYSDKRYSQNGQVFLSR